MTTHFDDYANDYDAWFIDNQDLLMSELLLVKRCLKDAGKTLSVGCGSGLFEKILRDEHDIDVQFGIEPSQEMAKIATARGMSVQVGGAEEVDFGSECYDCVMFNGSPGYITDLAAAVTKAYTALKPNGKIILIDVPKESSYALLYNLAKMLGTWDHPLLEGVTPRNCYPIELVKAANWRTTQEKVECMQDAGFSDFEFAQTLVRLPLYSDKGIEEPCDGCDQGDYVAICAYKK